ncbi:hypothetical protein CPT03_10705 [Pedobacter ginsengisoli]|uniref:Uncharacterized protein n=1 Tax=Pedobacter ginsengisoli TaxID=363852 RepID=A0A2D1U5P1_9SPHI|nr:hypothetical protein [Pedobacter ginsengisoli]ATP56915.1 hypothetical protein CPT03_10705 [Pedobacter ginsengisoli]
MKFLALFLAIVVITLTITPCCALEGAEIHAHETTQKGKHECNEKSDECCKDCSPFYVCGTCVGFTFASQSLLTFAVQLKPVQHNTAYIPVELPIIPSVIWQPPKLI